MMQVADSIDSIRNGLKPLRQQGQTIAFVPTMGNLHDGHLSLVDIAKQHADVVVVSIYVNPMQFGPNEDFDAYPRTLQDDLDKLAKIGVDWVFTPTDKVIYPNGRELQTFVEVPELTHILCGKNRPGHFNGVTTVVNKLFNIVQPDFAVFGEKDYQQLQVIKKMVDDLNLPVTIIPAPIAREDNGLARSSRNQYLTSDERQSAALLNQVLQWCAMELAQQQDYRQLEQDAIAKLAQQGFNVDYFEIRHADGLALAESDDGIKELMILAAAFYGKPRLLDNLQVVVN